MVRKNNIIFAMLILLILTISCNQKRDNSCKYLELTQRYVEGEEVDGVSLQESVAYLEKITGIESEYDGSPLALKLPSLKTVSKWEEALKRKDFRCK